MVFYLVASRLRYTLLLLAAATQAYGNKTHILYSCLPWLRCGATRHKEIPPKREGGASQGEKNERCFLIYNKTRARFVLFGFSAALDRRTKAAAATILRAPFNLLRARLFFSRRLFVRCRDLDHPALLRCRNLAILCCPRGDFVGQCVKHCHRFVRVIQQSLHALN